MSFFSFWTPPPPLPPLVRLLGRSALLDTSTGAGLLFILLSFSPRRASFLSRSNNSPSCLPPETRCPSALVFKLSFACSSVKRHGPRRLRDKAFYCRIKSPRFRHMGIPWLVTTCSMYESVDPNNTLCLSSTITLTNAFRLKSASKNCTLHFLASRTNSNFASPSARMALPPAGLQTLQATSLKRPHARGCTSIDCDLHDLAQRFHGKSQAFSKVLRLRQF